MGIKDINSTLKKHTPDAFMTIPLSKFSGKAIGIDSSLWMFKAKSSAMKDVLKSMSDPLQKIDEDLLIKSMISHFYGFIFKICSCGVTPVWIFDGETHPAKVACERRKKVRVSKKNSINDERERLLAMDPLQRKSEMDKFVKSLLSCFSFTKKEEEALKNEISSLGLPMFTAPHDAEIFASALSKNRLLIGVWTSDTDTYAAGALTTISGFSKEYSSEGIQIEIVLLSFVIDGLGVTHDEFRDFCILHECDFNQRIPGLGPANIIKKMKEYNWKLDSFVENESDREWEMVNIEECRKIFDGPNVDHIKIEDIYIDKSKWFNHLNTKTFHIDLPANPQVVELL